MSVVDFFDRTELSRHAIAARLQASRRIPIDTLCTTPSGVHVVIVTGAPDEHNRHPVRLELAGGRTRDFMLPAISLTPIEEDQP